MNRSYTEVQNRQKAEAIRRQYTRREDSKMDQLERLDDRVKMPGRIAAVSVGVVGALVMGTGMSLVMVWDSMAAGLALGIPGLAALLLAYPLYVWMTGRRKQKYAAEILRLSDELLQE